MKQVGIKQREKEDAKHRRQGPTSSWEEPLVHGLGLDWRDRREECSHSKDWWDISKPAMRCVLDRWGIKQIVPRDNQEKVSAKRHRTEASCEIPKQN